MDLCIILLICNLMLFVRIRCEGGEKLDANNTSTAEGPSLNDVFELPLEDVPAGGTSDNDTHQNNYFIRFEGPTTDEMTEKGDNIQDLVSENETNITDRGETRAHKKTMNEIIEVLLEHEFEPNVTKTHKYESLTPLRDGEELSNVIVNESFLEKLSDIDWQMTMEKMHHTLWNYWNNEFHKEYVQRIPSSLRQLRTLTKKIGLSSLFDNMLGETVERLNPNTKTADRKIQKLFKKIFENESKLETSEIKYKRAEESMINMVIELKGYIRIFLKLIDIKASQVGLLLLNKIQRKNFAKLSTNLSMFKDNIKNCPVHTAFSYRYNDLNFDLLMHHEKGFGVWNTAQLKSKINNLGKANQSVLNDISIANNIDEMINLVYNEFITPIALIGSSIEDITLIHSSLIRTLWKNISTQYKVPLYNIFESITKATFFFIKQIDDKIYEINNRKISS